MTNLADVPWSDLRLGDRCISAIGNEGEIIDLNEIGFSGKGHNPPIDPERGYTIKIQWENGNISWHPHWDMGAITYVGRPST